jgi:hypothetical protein
MNIRLHPRAWLPLVMIVLLGACSQERKGAVCDDDARRRARQFITQVLEQEANGLRLRELAAKGGRRVFYANVAYDPAEEPAWDLINIRNAFKVGEASCSSELSDEEGRVAAQLMDVRVEFPAGLWFNRENYGELPAGEHTYTLRLEDKFKITSRLPQPFVSGKTALSFLGAEPYTADRLLALREDIVKTMQQ